MTTISDENGIINNFAKEPAMYYAEEPSSQDKKSYLLWGTLASVLVATSVFTAIAIS